jgi:hypothetical protein
VKVYEGVDVQMQVFLISALVGREWSASGPGRFTDGERVPRYPLDMRPGGPQNRPGRRGEKSCPYRDKKADPSAVEPVASRYTDRCPGSRYDLICLFFVDCVSNINLITGHEMAVVNPSFSLRASINQSFSFTGLHLSPHKNILA